MTSFNELKYSITINAPRDVVWAKLTDWESQTSWMAMTHVTTKVSESGEPLGTEIFALTGIAARRNFALKKYCGILDHMVVTKWQPPQMCEVDHIGKVIKGIGRFTLHQIEPAKTKFDWYEQIDAPKILMLVIRPAVMLGVRFSLWRFTRLFRTE